VSAPFGLETSYDRGWVGRYHALASKLETTNVNPTIAYRPTDWLAIGIGADVEYAKARLTNAIDLGGVCEIFGAQAGLPPGACTALGFPPQSVDGVVKISGDDWGAGFNAGIMVAPWRTTRIGLAFRSDRPRLDGRATFFLPKKAMRSGRSRVRSSTRTAARRSTCRSARRSGLPRNRADGCRAGRRDVDALVALGELVFKFANRQPTIVAEAGRTRSGTRSARAGVRSPKSRRGSASRETSPRFPTRRCERRASRTRSGSG
jgi:hypothetical protein